MMVTTVSLLLDLVLLGLLVYFFRDGSSPRADS